MVKNNNLHLKEVNAIRELCLKHSKIIRKKSIETLFEVQYGHPATDLCIADIMSVMYGAVLNVNPESPNDPDRDRFIVSKGHASLALYVALALKGFFDFEELSTFTQAHSRLCAAVSTRTPGVEANTGALGHGVPIAVGCALAAKLDKSDRQIYCLVGDGELQEGSNWEAFMLAATRKLNNLCIIVDRNRVQKGAPTETTNSLDPLDEKFRAFGLSVSEIDGHSIDELLQAISSPSEIIDKPRAIIANTIKGKGLSFMENDLSWHNKKLDTEHFELAMKELS